MLAAGIAVRALGDAGERDAGDAEFVQHRVGGGELPRAAVDEDEVGDAPAGFFVVGAGVGEVGFGMVRRIGFGGVGFLGGPLREGERQSFDRPCRRRSPSPGADAPSSALRERVDDAAISFASRVNRRRSTSLIMA